jgi:hypothetical protein
MINIKPISGPRKKFGDHSFMQVLFQESYKFKE